GNRLVALALDVDDALASACYADTVGPAILRVAAWLASEEVQALRRAAEIDAHPGDLVHWLNSNDTTNGLRSLYDLMEAGRSTPKTLAWLHAARNVRA